MIIQRKSGISSIAIVGILALLLIAIGATYYRMSRPAPQTNKQPPPPIAPHKSITVPLTAQSNSSGARTATVEDIDGVSTRITIVRTNATSGASESARLHRGSCASPGSTVYPLNDMTNGKSETIISTSVHSILFMLPLAISIYQPARAPAATVACRDIPASAMDMMMGRGN